MKNKWQVKKVSTLDIVGTEKNANKMSDKEFEKLCKNIERTGLSSMIACYESADGKFHIISGNHRFRACCAIGYSELDILYVAENELSNDEIIALQLSHNSLHGSDDKGILRSLFEDIEGIEFKEFAHISVADIQKTDMTNMALTPISEHYRLCLMLYNDDLNLLSELLGLIREEIDQSDMVIVANGEGTEAETIELLTTIRAEFGIKSAGIAFGKILKLARDQLQTLQNTADEVC